MRNENIKMDTLKNKTNPLIPPYGMKRGNYYPLLRFR